ncbi:Evolved beta-galactosidase subunit alpha [Limihaloglobus sulfuriphilus]|uniref:beta-mannosidase n=1 Tax=Limihaloglobus sulfuriphilus TaxID=1851148 RepID=A0A1Q2MFN9_9BACT|nr:glycoside hydrolase family 2 TIM barrel-domain containing protein [Limihaloglobus sulfuriphilus]AQQ71479.1 Evolved beta-galactosidase subunit alpha [Limihaloglobus sulfuriphilus]
MRNIRSLGNLKWQLAGFKPHEWRRESGLEVQDAVNAETPPMPAKVPGSVQKTLLDAGLIEDWNHGLNSFKCEWVENRHWIYETTIPDNWISCEKEYRLVCRGLDYCGSIFLNKKEIYSFKNSHIPHNIELTPHLKNDKNVLRIVFQDIPRWLGQLGFTSQMRDFKPRYNYSWDWTCRMVQIGISGDIYIEEIDGPFIVSSDLESSYDTDTDSGQLDIKLTAQNCDQFIAAVKLTQEDRTVAEETKQISQNGVSFSFEKIQAKPWYPNGHGQQPLYNLEIKLCDANGCLHDKIERRVGFKNVQWKNCLDAPAAADPWICCINGRDLFMQGINWTPIHQNYVETAGHEYRKRLEIYKEIGVNIVRVWGGAPLEKDIFYEICDELGIMVWQEFPISSSGIENYPPDDEDYAEEMISVAKSYIQRRKHHVSLLMWCGGNELSGSKNELIPASNSHKLLNELNKTVMKYDPNRRFAATSPLGPKFFANEKNYGKGLHWDVHGPWKLPGTFEQWQQYWNDDDSLLRSETGCPGASSADIIEKYKGGQNPMPTSTENPLWRRTGWWVEWKQFIDENGREPESLVEYVEWSQQRQAKALAVAAASCKNRFPKCGGFIVWMGHDCFPCTANTSIVDFEGNPKPAAIELAEIFKANEKSA